MTKTKLKKIVTRVIAGVAITALVIVNLQIGISDNENSDMSLSQINMSLFTPAIAATGQGGSIACHKKADYNINHMTVLCDSCAVRKGLRGLGEARTCSND